MSENKKNLSLEDLDNVAGGQVVCAAMPDGQYSLRGLNGRELATAPSLTAAQDIAAQYGLSVLSEAEAVNVRMQPNALTSAAMRKIDP